MTKVFLPPAEFVSPYDAFQATARAWPGNAFLCIPPHEGRDYHPAGAEFTYAEAAQEVERLRRLYERSGFGHGHRVAALLGNRPEHFFNLLALNALGTGVVPINPDSTPDEMHYQVEHSEADIAVTSPGRMGDMVAVAARRTVPLPVHDITALPDRLDAPKRPPLAAPIGRATEAELLYTSGTTGKPKGCIISNEYFLTSGSWYLQMGGRLAIEHGNFRLFNPFPVFHMNAGVLSLTAMILSANCLISADRFHPRTWWRDLVATRANAMHYMGVIPPVLLKQDPVPEERQHQVRFALGAGVDPVIHPAVEERFGFPFVEVWGMTETGRIMADCLEPRRIDTRAIGRPLNGLEAMAADDDDRPVPPGTPGQLLVRFAGPDPRRGFFSGYFKEEAATEEAWRNGWFHTGDVVQEDPDDGMLIFVDRRKNIVRRSGENIAAAEVEETLMAHPAVHTVAVMAVPDEMRDEEVMACVVLAAGQAPDAATAEALFAHCRERIAYYKAPGWIAFRDELPVTTTSKIRKGMIFGDRDPRIAPGVFDLRDRKKRR